MGASFGLLLTLLAALVTGAPAVAATAGLAPPQQVIQRVSDGLALALREDRAGLADRAAVRRLVDRLFLPHIDVERVSALVLGQFWRDATPEQRRAFTRAFEDLVINSYAHAVHEIGDWEVRFLPLRPGERADRVVVRTEVLRPRAAPVAVDYRMVEEQGRWRAYDVLVEGISLLSNYRSSFTAIARARGIDGLIAELQRRNATAPGARPPAP